MYNSNTVRVYYIFYIYIYVLEIYFLLFSPVESADCDIVDRHRDMTLCTEQDDEIIINPDTNHNHQPLLSVDTDCAKQQFGGGRCQPIEDTKDSSVVNKK